MGYTSRFGEKFRERSTGGFYGKLGELYHYSNLQKDRKGIFAKISHDSLVSIWSPKLLIVTNDRKLLDSKSKLVMNYFR